MIDVIGTLYTAPVMNGEEVVTPAKPLAGWHVNSSEPVEGWDIHRVEPKAMRRVFFGAPTYCYVFESQEAFELAQAVTNVM